MIVLALTMMNYSKFLFAGYATVCMEFEGNKYYYRIIKDNDDYNFYEIITTDIADCLSSKSLYEGKIDRNGLSKSTYKKLWKRQVRVFDLAVRSIFKGRSRFLSRIGVNIHHAGYCAKCNRVLKTPEAIQHGIGNECFKDMNIDPKENLVYVGLAGNQNDQSSGTRNNGKRQRTKRSVKSND